jgi:hypothetical protein
VDAEGVYVAGFYSTGSNKTTWYWDGTWHELETGSPDIDATSITRKNQAIYVGGHYELGTYPYVATYWEDNGDVNSYTTYSHTFDIFVTDTGEVYTAGDYWNTDNAVMAAGYWMNESFDKNDLYTGDTSRANGIDVVGGKVYAAGYYGSAGAEVACYWEVNDDESIEKMEDLEDDGADSAKAKDIQVVSDSVYVCGYYNDGEKYIACYWKDGVKTDLYDSEVSTQNAEALSITIK